MFSFQNIMYKTFDCILGNKVLFYPIEIYVSAR